MQIVDLISIHAATDTRRLNTLLQTHYSNVQSIVKAIKDSGDIIQMSNAAQKIMKKGGEEGQGYQTVIYHGMTRSSEKKTFVQTLPNGTMKKWTEAVNA